MTIINPHHKSSAASIAYPTAYTKVINTIPQYLDTTVVSCLQKTVLVAINLLGSRQLENCEPEKKLIYMGLGAYLFPHIKGVRTNAITETTAK